MKIILHVYRHYVIYEDLKNIILQYFAIKALVHSSWYPLEYENIKQ